MRFVGSVLVVSALWCSAGCGDDESALQGIFAIERWTANPAGCDAEGPAAPEEAQYSHFFVRDDNFFGEQFLVAVTCSDLASCRTMAAETDTLFLGGFFFESGDDDAGWTGTNGYLGGDTCDGEVNATGLTGESGAAVTLRRESRTVTEVPKNGDGECDLDAAFAQAEDQPCERLEVVTGGFVEGL